MNEGIEFEKLTGQDSKLIHQSYGALLLLQKLLNNSDIGHDVYKQESKYILGMVSDITDCAIKDESELHDILENYAYNNNMPYKSSATFGFRTLANILLIIFSILLAISSGYMFQFFIIPIISSWPPSIRISLAFSVTISILCIAKYYCTLRLQPYVAFIGSLGIALSYAYALSFCQFNPNSNIAFIISPICCIWFALTIYFNTKLIGFITILSFQIIVGFYVHSLPFNFIIGFTSDYNLLTPAISSGIILFFYILFFRYFHTQNLPSNLLLYSYDMINLYSTGIQFLCTIGTFVPLFILSSIHYNHDHDHKDHANTSTITTLLFKFFFSNFFFNIIITILSLISVLIDCI